jgi:hypothetical protein
MVMFAFAVREIFRKKKPFTAVLVLIAFVILRKVITGIRVKGKNI